MPNRARIEPASDLTSKVQKLTDVIDRLHRRGAVRTLRRVLIKLHPADLAHALTVLPDGHIAPVFDAIPDERLAGDVFAELGARARACVLEEIPVEQLSPIFEQMAPDELTDTIQQLPEEYAARLMARLAPDSKEQVEGLLRFPPDTAGGIMTPDFFALADSESASDAIADVRQRYDVEIVSYLYVTDAEGHLAGVVSLRQLLLAAPETPLSDIMNRRIVSVRTDTPQHLVAELVDKYQLLALPVVDEHGMLVGMVTIDDVIEVIESQATRHMLRMAGTDHAETLTQSPFKVAYIRLPWLAAAFAGGLIATAIIQRFEPILSQVLTLGAFVPIVMGMAGNVGVQTATVTVRGLATGVLEPQNAGAMIFKELRVGLMLGLVYSVLLGAFGWYFFGDIKLAEVVGLTLLINMTGASVLAIVLPLTFDRLGADPAIATGPFVTTAIDVFGVLNYFLIANMIIGLV
jgi:magnesium transporter